MSEIQQKQNLSFFHGAPLQVTSPIRDTCSHTAPMDADGLTFLMHIEDTPHAYREQKHDRFNTSEFLKNDKPKVSHPTHSAHTDERDIKTHAKKTDVKVALPKQSSVTPTTLHLRSISDVQDDLLDNRTYDIPNQDSETSDIFLNSIDTPVEDVSPNVMTHSTVPVAPVRPEDNIASHPHAIEHLEHETFPPIVHIQNKGPEAVDIPDAQIDQTTLNTLNIHDMDAPQTHDPVLDTVMEPLRMHSETPSMTTHDNYENYENVSNLSEDYVASSSIDTEHALQSPGVTAPRSIVESDAYAPIDLSVQSQSTDEVIEASVNTVQKSSPPQQFDESLGEHTTHGDSSFSDRSSLKPTQLHHAQPSPSTASEHTQGFAPLTHNVDQHDPVRQAQYQLAQDFRHALLMRNTAFDVHLTPKGMGQVHIRINFNKKEVEALFEVDAKSYAAFERQRDQFTGLFEAHGFNMSKTGLQLMIRKQTDMPSQKSSLTHTSPSPSYPHIVSHISEQSVIPQGRYTRSPVTSSHTRTSV